MKKQTKYRTRLPRSGSINGKSPVLNFELSASGKTDVGLKRLRNEDAFYCDTEKQLFIVCDGLGGMSAGDRASAASIEAISRCLIADRMNKLARSADQLTQAKLRESLVTANHALIQIVQEHPECDGMGSTAIIAMIEGETAHIANIGDSRGYLIRNGIIGQLTRDDSVAWELIEAGQISATDARGHKLRNRLTACLGHVEDVLNDGLYIRLRAGDTLLLCTDGLWEPVADEEIVSIVCGAESTEQAVDHLAEAANRAGGPDNITAVVISISKCTGMQLATANLKAS